MRSKLGFSKGHDISLQDLSHSSLAQQPSKPGKNGTVRTTQRTHGVSTYKLHCAAKTAKFFLARKLTAKQEQKHAEHAESNTDHVAATADHASENNVLPTRYQVTEHAPTHKGTKQRVPQEPNFHSSGTPVRGQRPGETKPLHRIKGKHRPVLHRLREDVQESGASGAGSGHPCSPEEPKNVSKLTRERQAHPTQL